MMNAKKARELVEQAIELKVAENRKKAEDFCESLTEKIQLASSLRKTELLVENIPDETFSYVWGILKDNGYKTTQMSNRVISIAW